MKNYLNTKIKIKNIDIKNLKPPVTGFYLILKNCLFIIFINLKYVILKFWDKKLLFNILYEAFSFTKKNIFKNYDYIQIIERNNLHKQDILIKIYIWDQSIL